MQVNKLTIFGVVPKTIWVLQWMPPAKGVSHVICFFTEEEANVALRHLTDWCDARRINPDTLPRAAAVIMLDALSRGDEPIEFTPAASLPKRRLH